MITQDQPLVSIIIVNTHEEKFIAPLIDSIRQIENELRCEIIIMDNDSKGELQSHAEARLPGVKIISIPENVGFCRTNNMGLRAASGNYVLLMNPDTLLKENSITRCMQYLENHLAEKIGAIACRLENADGSLQRSFFRLAASMKRTMQGNAIYIKMFGQRIKHRAERSDDELHQKTSNAPWICGAFLLMRREILMKNSFFLDEDFFLYSDDVELGYRIRSRGYKLIYYPEASITHFGGGNRPYLKRFEQLTISEWLCMMKIHGKMYFLFNQLLLSFNLLTDELLFRSAVLRKKISFNDKREKIIRRRIWLLWEEFTFRILMKFHRKPSSSNFMLKYR